MKATATLMNTIYTARLRRTAIAMLLALALVPARADVPAGYYNPANGLTKTALQVALHGIIDNHTDLDYAYLWTAFQSTDKKPNGKVWDMYSDIPGGTPPYEFTFIQDQDIGSGGTTEGDVYNREHSWPKSWFNDLSPMNSDLFHLYPTDKLVNNKRGSYPYGEVGSTSWTSLNGSKVGSCSYPGYTGTVFEPIDEYKGDLARTYFYMSVRYYGEDGVWAGSAMTTGAQLKDWALAMLLDWHAADPVSQKELDRNDAVYALQHNRNPFIDNAAFAELIWGDPAATDPAASGLNPAGFMLQPAYPNPFNPATMFAVTINRPMPVRISILDIGGHEITQISAGPLLPAEYNFSWDGSLANGSKAPSGLYIIAVRGDRNFMTQKILLLR
ncbi:MAG: endonuclease [Candidatus Neomarinimicrobiota bacterium]